MLSDDPDPVLTLQGVFWARHKAIEFATVTLNIKQYFDDDDATHIDIVQTPTGGIEGSTELRTINGTDLQHFDTTYGHVISNNRWINFADVEGIDSFLTEGWEDQIFGEAPGPDGKHHIYNIISSEEKGWNGVMVWGFAVVEGKRHYVRRLFMKNGYTVLKTRFVYDWQKK
jgi:hypothetical protein